MKQLFVIILFFIATQVYSQHTAARKLNDSAVAVIQGDVGTPVDYEKAIDLLNQATSIDSNYYLAYGNKISYLLGLRRYPEALKAVEQMRRIKPALPEPLTMTGIIYECIKDSITSKKNFEAAVVIYDRMLDTLSKDNFSYNYTLVNKAVNMVLAGQEEQGRAIMQQLRNHNWGRSTIAQMMNELFHSSRQEIIDSFTDH